MDGSGSASECDEKAILLAKNWISEHFDFMFLYLGCLDERGHQYKFCSQEYMTQVARTDEMILDLFLQLEKENILNSTYIILTSDHGGNI